MTPARRPVDRRSATSATTLQPATRAGCATAVLSFRSLDGCAVPRTLLESWHRDEPGDRSRRRLREALTRDLQRHVQVSVGAHDDVVHPSELIEDRFLMRHFA